MEEHLAWTADSPCTHCLQFDRGIVRQQICFGCSFATAKTQCPGTHRTAICQKSWSNPHEFLTGIHTKYLSLGTRVGPHRTSVLPVPQAHTTEVVRTTVGMAWHKIVQVIINFLDNNRHQHLAACIIVRRATLITEYIVFFSIYLSCNHLCMFLISIGIVIFTWLSAFLYGIAISFLTNMYIKKKEKLTDIRNVTVAK